MVLMVSRRESRGPVSGLRAKTEAAVASSLFV